ncbi:MAG: MYG1 family protein [Clostridia bacterium]
MEEANCVTHSGKFHVDDVISTIFLSKLKKNVILLRISTIDNNLNLENKLIYDIGLRRI